MYKITIAIGVALIVLGLGFYFGTGAKSMTAMIPAFVGLPVLIFGSIACCGGEKARKHGAHAAVMITLLGAIAGLVMGIMRMGVEGKGTVVAASLSMAALCIVHVILSVRFFIAARKAREAAAAMR